MQGNTRAAHCAGCETLQLCHLTHTCSVVIKACCLPGMQEMEEAEALAERNANLVHAITYQVRCTCPASWRTGCLQFPVPHQRAHAVWLSATAELCTAARRVAACRKNAQRVLSGYHPCLCRKPLRASMSPRHRMRRRPPTLLACTSTASVRPLPASLPPTSAPTQWRTHGRLYEHALAAIFALSKPSCL